MKITNICIIGAGNISNTRHIPAILKNKSMNVIGIVSNEKKKLERTKDKYKFIKNELLINEEDDCVEQLSDCKWFMEEVDAVVIGVPPMQHFSMTKGALKCGKHVLVEKPMMMNVNECEEVSQIARSKKLVLMIMHSFQFSNGVMELDRRFKSGELGKIESILELQLTNRNRRLPTWYNDLPLGLYYDEAAHFFYGARRFGGSLKVLNAHAQFNENHENTPKFLEVQLLAGKIPVQMYMNFNAPICEWGFFLICDKKIAIYDYFKDILVVINNDEKHLAKDVLKVSFSFLIQFCFGYIRNGYEMLSGNLLYGHDQCIKHFAQALTTGNVPFEISADLGMEVVSAMNDVVEIIRMEK